LDHPSDHGNFCNLDISEINMKTYLKWHEQSITDTDFSDQNINHLYDQGYLFGRTGKGELYQTRSLRIDLAKFKLSSENRRILKKTENITLTTLQIPYPNYHWSIGKLGKDFYTTKFGDGTFSANKIKELLTAKEKTNFNKLLAYQQEGQAIGYCIALETNDLLHYCYPFYQLQPTTYNLPTTNTGLGMMLGAILYAQNQNKKYIYLGSASRPTDTYKLQFTGLEWFDGKEWKTDQTELKVLLAPQTQNMNAENSLGGLGEAAV
jgi:arginyl-tRNA--protein-N-Asp/Glu arginylyltransferase